MSAADVPASVAGRNSQVVSTSAAMRPMRSETIEVGGLCPCHQYRPFPHRPLAQAREKPGEQPLQVSGAGSGLV